MASSALRLGVPVSSGVEAGACTRGSGLATAADVAAEVPPLSDGACAEESRDAPAADVAAEAPPLSGAPAADVAAEAPPLSDGVCAGASAGAPGSRCCGGSATVAGEVDSSIFSGGSRGPLACICHVIDEGCHTRWWCRGPIVCSPCVVDGEERCLKHREDHKSAKANAEDAKLNTAPPPPPAKGKRPSQAPEAGAKKKKNVVIDVLLDRIHYAAAH